MNILSLYSLVTNILLEIMNVYCWIVIGYCLISMVIGFGIGDARSSRVMLSIYAFLARLVEPVLTPIRNLLPNTGMMDLSPLVLLVLLQYVLPWLLRQGQRLLYMA